MDTQILPAAKKYGIPESLAAPQAAVESGRKSNKENNYFGLLSGGELIPYKSIDEGVKAYAQTVKALAGDVKPSDSAQDILKKLQSGKQKYDDGSDQNAYIDTITNTPEYRRYAGGGS